MGLISESLACCMLKAMLILYSLCKLRIIKSQPILITSTEHVQTSRFSGNCFIAPLMSVNIFNFNLLCKRLFSAAQILWIPRSLPSNENLRLSPRE